jgi:NADH:ubiquinone reductase (H+-translocating)
MVSSQAVRPHVVILGGGFGGLHAARALRHAPVRVTLVDRQNHHVFQPLLYQAATAQLETPDIGYPFRSVLRGHKNTEVLMTEAETIDAEAQTVQLASGDTLHYDYLIVATGAQSFYFGHAEWRAHAPGLKSIRDALEIRYRVLIAFERAEQEHDPEDQRAHLTFVIVGGGPTGVELAGAVAELARHALKRDFRHIDPTRARVLLVEAGPTILPTYPKDLQAKALKQLTGLGVEVRTSASVRNVDEHGVLVGDEPIAARTVLWGAGMVGTPIARSLGVPLDRHGLVEVTPTLNPPGRPNVFVIGDLAALVQDGRPVPGVAPAAIQEGRYAARAIIDGLRGKPIKPFHYWNKGELATIGRSKAVALLPGNVRLSGFLAWMVYSTVHLLYLVGHRSRVRVFLSWLWSFFTYARGARLIPSAEEEEKRLLEQARPAGLPMRGEPPPPPPPEQH